MVRIKTVTQRITVMLSLFVLSACLESPTVTSSWKTAHFSHTGFENTCSPCHSTEKPTALINHMDHTDFAQGDCAPCHQAHIGTSWKDGSFPHSSPVPSTCSNCHSTDSPTGIYSEMAHNYSGLPDCASCHTQNIGTLWGGGNYSHSPSPETCQDCHAPQRPTDNVGSPSFSHLYGNGTGDCSFCHNSPGITWSGGAVFTHSPTPNSCIGCHLINLPIGLVGDPSFDHAIAGTGDCVSCHTSNIGVSWTGGQYSHSPTPTSCADCHSSEMPSGVVNSMSHAYANLPDCASCHTDAGVTWAAGNFSHSPTPTTCIPCHTALGISQHGADVGDCVSCHSNTSAWTAP